MKKKFIKTLALLTLTVVFSVQAIYAQNRNWPKEITFAVIPTAGMASMEDMFSGLTQHLSKELGIKVTLRSAGDYAGVIQAMQHKHVELAYFGPKSYVEANRRAGAEALVIEIDNSGQPGYHGYIITKKGSGLKTLADIKGKRWAFTDSNSTSGTLVPSVMFHQKGIDPQKYFSRVLYSGSHEASILSVKAGKVDAASTNDLDFNRGVGRNWKANEFNIIWTSKMIPGAPVAIRKDLPKSLKVAVTKALVNFKDAKALAKMKSKGFVPVKDNVYNSIRDLIEFQKSISK